MQTLYFLTQSLQFRNKLGRAYLTAITLNCINRIIMTSLSVGGTSVYNLCDQLAQSTSVANGAFNALVCQEATDHYPLHTLVAQHIIQMG